MHAINGHFITREALQCFTQQINILKEETEEYKKREYPFHEYINCFFSIQCLLDNYPLFVQDASDADTMLKCLNIQPQDSDHLYSLKQGIGKAKEIVNTFNENLATKEHDKSIHGLRKQFFKQIIQELDKDEATPIFKKMTKIGHIGCIALYKGALVLPDDKNFELKRLQKLTIFVMSKELLTLRE